MSKNSFLKKARKWILFISGFLVIAISFQLSKKIIDSNLHQEKGPKIKQKMYTLKKW